MKNILNLFLAAVLFPPASIAIGAPAQKASEATLIATLESNADQKAKANACRELARIASPTALPALVKLLPDENLSHMARYALETIPGAEVDKALRDSLKSLNGRQLAGVIGSLGIRRDEKAVKHLAEFLQHQDPDVAQAAGKALGSIGTTDAVEALQKALKTAPGGNQLAFCEGLLRAAERFASSGSDRRAQAIYDSLRQLTPAPHQVRTAALRGAVLTRGEKGISLLLEALRGSDYTQTAAAARLAQEMRLPQVTRALAEELPKLPADKQVLVIQALGQRGDPKALPALFKAVRSGEKPVRIEAMRASTRIADPSAVPVLLEAMGAPDADIARIAQENLSALPGKEADAAVTKMLKAEEPSKCLLAMDMAARRRMKSALPQLLQATRSAQPEVRVAAVRKIGELGGAEELSGLLDFLSRATSEKDTEAAEQALGSLCLNSPDPGQAVDRLAARIGQAQPAQRAALLRVMAAAGGPKALGHVRAAVKDPNAEVRTAAIRALSSWSSAEAAPDLLELARTSQNPADKMVCLRGYFALAKLGDVAEPQKLKMCRAAAALAQKPEEKRLLLAALGDITSPAAAADIQPFVDDSTVKEEACNAIVGIADRLLRRNNAQQFAARLVEPLEKAADATGNSDLSARARKLLETARSKGAQK